MVTLSDAIPITVVAQRKCARGLFIIWSDGRASRHFDDYDEWCSVEEAKRPMARKFGKGEQVGLFEKELAS